MSDRRFPPPWTAEDHNDAGFIVKDRNGYALAYVHNKEPRSRLLHRNQGFQQVASVNHFFSFKSVPLKVLTMPTMSPSWVSYASEPLYGSARKSASAFHWIFRVSPTT
jgi:hypothetical protein